MAKLTRGQSRKLSGNNPKLDINLEELFGVDLSGNDSLKQAIGQEIIDRIVSRTEGNTSLSGRAFKRYSKAYKQSDEFKAAGKGSKVNLRLSGDMLGLMDIVDERDNTLTIGWFDEDEAAKAHGHITGGGNLPKRDFFGLTSSDISSIEAKFASEIDEVKAELRSDSDEDAGLLGFAARLTESLRNG